MCICAAFVQPVRHCDGLVLASESGWVQVKTLPAAAAGCSSAPLLLCIAAC
jgi:hypothetical protein